MRKLSILMAAAGAMALMAFGASSASAVVLCSTSTSPCPSGDQYSANTEFTGLSTNAVLSTNITNVTCDESEATVENTAQSGSPLPGSVTALTWSGCETSSGTSCTVSTINLPYSNSSVAATGGGNGSVTVADDPGAHVQCGFFINCTFDASSVTGSLAGGDPAVLSFSNVSLQRTGGFCPSTATWTADYVLQSPDPTAVWVD